MKNALLGAVAGAVILAGIGFVGFGWQTSGMADARADAAVTNALAKACLSTVIDGRERRQLRELQAKVGEPNGPEQSMSQRFWIEWNNMPVHFGPYNSDDFHLYVQGIEQCGEKFVALDF